MPRNPADVWGPVGATVRDWLAESVQFLHLTVEHAVTKPQAAGAPMLAATALLIAVTALVFAVAALGMTIATRRHAARWRAATGRAPR